MGQEALDYEEWIEMIDNTLFVKSVCFSQLKARYSMCAHGQDGTTST